MKFGVLGPLTVAGPGGEWLRLRGERQRALLAMLLFHANQHVPAERLVNALWPDVPPKSYASNLQTYVSRLRDRIGRDRIEHAGPGYRLNVAEEDLDLLVFQAEAEQGRRAARAGDLTAAAGALRRALAQWRDRPLADLHLPVLDPEVARLEADRLAVFEDWADAELATGGHVELVGELQVMTARHPLRERLTGQLMLALQRSGRQSEALEVYRAARGTLIDELGVEPGEDLRRVHAAVLRGEGSSPVRPASVWPICQLPPEIADFCGRRAETDELVALLGTAADRVPLVVLSGEPGLGKSTLAVRVAHRLREAFPDGQLFVNLAGATEPRDAGDVLADLLRALTAPAGAGGNNTAPAGAGGHNTAPAGTGGNNTAPAGTGGNNTAPAGAGGNSTVPVQAIPEDLDARAAAFRGRLADRRVLLVLDDAADPAQVRPLLPGTSGCAVLVTSRRRLSGLAGAHRIMLAPFTDAEAASLLGRIAGQPRVREESADAARISAACGYLPLALRIAGTRLAARPNLQLASLADRLEDQRRRLDELAVGDLRLRSSLAMSYQSLTGETQRALRLIGAVNAPLMPGWSLAVLFDGRPCDDIVEELIEASLLQPAEAGDSREPHYRMHDIVRDFAHELALAEPDHAWMWAEIRRLLDTVFGLADLAARRLPRTMPLPDLTGDAPEPALAPDVVARLLDDPEGWLRTARQVVAGKIAHMCRAGLHREAMLMFERLGRSLWLNGHYSELRAGAESLAEGASRAGKESIAARAETVLAVLLQVRGRFEEAVRAYRRCAERLARLDDRPALAWVLNNLANCLNALGEPEEALHLAGQADVLFADDAFGKVSALRTRSTALNRLGRPEESARIDTETLAYASGDPRQLALALQSLSWSLVLSGELRRAGVLAAEAVSLLRTTTARSLLAQALRSLGAIRAGLGERRGSLDCFRESRQIAERLNEQPRVISCTRAIAASWIGDGRADAAIPVLRQCLRAQLDMGSVPATTITLRLLATAYEATGAEDAARAAREEADHLGDPRDANTSTLVELLLNLTRAA